MKNDDLSFRCQSARIASYISLVDRGADVTFNPELVANSPTLHLTRWEADASSGQKKPLKKVSSEKKILGAFL
jgi:hypothetical protein